MKRGDIERSVIAIDLEVVPERTMIGMREPLVVVRRQFREERVAGEGHDVEVRLHIVAAVPEGLELRLIGRISLSEAAGGVGSQPGQGPALVEAELESATVVAPAL